MKKLSSTAVLLAASIAFFSQAACAEELWDPHLRGVNEGLAAGALPPPGVYGILDNYWAGYDQYDNHGHKTGVKLDALVEVPIVLWQTGLKVFGGDYAVALAQPFDYTNLKAPGVPASNAHWGSFNTILVPGQISWALPNNFHVSTGLQLYLKDASSSPAHPPANKGVGSGDGFWTIMPTVGVSWLADGWNLSMDGSYSINTPDTNTHYTSGQELAIDYTAAKTIDKWTFGVGLHQENQLTDDSGSGAAAAGCGSKNGCRVTNFGAGPLIGYQFSGVSVMAEYNHNIYARNDVAGEIYNIRLVAPF